MIRYQFDFFIVNLNVPVTNFFPQFPLFFICKRFTCQMKKGIVEMKHLLSESFKVAFKASMDPNLAVAIPGSTERCFGPFNTDVPVPYSVVALNDGNGYNPSLGKTNRKGDLRL